MASIIKSISLDPQTAQLASQVPNFSRFVRECLIRHHLACGGAWAKCERENDEDKLCLPMKTPRCLKCWPAGPPPREAWTTYVRAPRTHDPYGKPLGKYTRTVNPDYMNHELVQAAALEANPALFDFKDMVIEGNAKPKSKKKRRSFIGKLLNVLRL
tara:strand:- start:1096 stop:1566 length:471 start_codon:yes stop_codon:yes gene_type:complete